MCCISYLESRHLKSRLNNNNPDSLYGCQDFLLAKCILKGQNREVQNGQGIYMKKRKKKHKYRQIAVLGFSTVVLISCLFLYAYQEGIIQFNNDSGKVNQEYSQEELSTEENRENINVSLDVNIIYQFPDMPSGCEVTSLAMVLNYIGIDVTNKYLADNYLDSSTYDMSESFVGNVYDDNSFGCFAPVIVRTANDFFEDNNYQYEAVNVSESTKQQLIGYLCDNKPVIIWNTQDMQPTYIEEYNLNGYKFTWWGNEHCVVLCGYNEEDNTFEIADSIAGKVRRDADTFFKRYEDMLSQAVIINNK